MTVPAALTAAIDVFTELGWAEATLADVETLPLGTPEQQRVARKGLASGEWGRWGSLGANSYGWISAVSVDEQMLAVFALRVGVDDRRAMQLLRDTVHGIDDDVVARLLRGRGPQFAARFVTQARGWHLGVALRLVDHHRIEVPHDVGYLDSWVAYADRTLRGIGEPGTLWWCEPEIVLRRVPDHVRAGVAAGVFGSGPFGAVIPAAAEQGLVDRDEAVDLVLTALDAAQRPSDRKVWTQVLTTPRGPSGLGLTDAELVAHADTLIGPLSHGDGQVVERLAPALIAGVDDALLGDVLTVALLTRVAKAARVVLRAAASRPRPSDQVVDAVAPLILAHIDAPNRQLAQAARTLVEAWGIASDEDGAGEDDTGDTEVRGLWQPTPPVWEVPRFELGDISADALTEAAAVLTGRPEGVVDIEVERFLALANAVARADEAAARTALGGVRGDIWIGGLRCVAPWLAGEPSPQLDQPAAAREGAVFQRLGAVPVLLSTPTWVDLRIDPADLIDRLREYADAGAQLSEADLFLALLRIDLTLVDAGHVDAFDDLTVPVVYQSGGLATVTAGPRIRNYLQDPLREPALEMSSTWRRWTPATVVVPESLSQFPARIDWRGGYGMPDLVSFPTWGDSARWGIGHGESAAAGLVLRQLARRATPLTPGLAINLIGAQRGFHPAAAPDGTAAIHEAWQRGLLRPGVADVRFLDWRETPSHLASLARACGDLADQGLLSVVWPVLDEILLASLRAPRMLSGTAEIAETLRTLLPEVSAAVTAGLADPESLNLPGIRALAARTGSSRAVTAAQAVVAELTTLTPATAESSDGDRGEGPEPQHSVPTPPPAALAHPARPFEEIWSPGAGSAPAVDDGAILTAQWVEVSAASRMMAVNLTLPDRPEDTFQIVTAWFHALENEGQCGARLEHSDPGDHPAHQDSWLHWDAPSARLVVSPHRNWIEGTNGPLAGSIKQVPPLTTSMAAVLLASLCHDGAAADYSVRKIVEAGLIGSAAVTVAMRALLTQPDISPARMVRLIESDPTTLPVLWPVLVESVRYAAGVEGALPHWVNRVLDVALLYADYLREAATRGLLPAESATWPGLTDLAARKGSSVALRKSRTLAELLLPTP